MAEGGTTTIIEVTTMGIGRETGISIINHALLGAIAIATKVRSQTQGWTGWLLVITGQTGRGAHTSMTLYLLTRPKMDHYTLIPARVLLPMWRMACILFQS